MLLAGALASCDVALLRGLSPDEAQSISAELQQRGVVVRVVPDTASRMRLELNEASVPDAVSALTRGSSAAARCEPPESAAGGGWVETPAEERARTATRLSRELSHSLALLPGVADARVHVTLAAGMRSVPETLARPAASVLLVRSNDAPLGTGPEELVAGAVPGLTPSQVRIVETTRPQAPPRPKLARLGPIVVAQSSLGTLRTWLGVALLVQIVLALAVLRPLASKLRTPRA